MPATVAIQAELDVAKREAIVAELDGDVVVGRGEEFAPGARQVGGVGSPAVFEYLESGGAAVHPSLDADGKLFPASGRFGEWLDQLGEVRCEAYGVLPCVERLRLRRSVEESVEQSTCASGSVQHEQ